VNFSKKNGLLSIIRAHEAQDAGYKMHRRNDRTGFPSLITLFSAPNYLDAYNNKGALMRYENNVINIRQFNYSPHPYNLQGFMNVFNWSLPFVADKLGEFLAVLFNLVDDVQAHQEEIIQEEVNRKREALRSKLRSVSRMLTLYKTMKLGSADVPDGKGIFQNLHSPEIPHEETQPIAERVNEPRPPGIIEVIAAAKIEPSTPERLRRKQSRDKILSLKKQQELRQKVGITVFDGKGESPGKDGNKTLKYSGSSGEIPIIGAITTNEGAITTTTTTTTHTTKGKKVGRHKK